LGLSAPPRVALLTPLFGRDGGTGAHVVDACAVLARAGARPLALCGRATSSEPEGAGVVAIPGLEDASVPAAAAAAAHAALDAAKVDLVHAVGFDDPGVLDAVVARWPLVYAVHGYRCCTSGYYHFAPGEECTRAHGVGCVPNLLLRGCWHARDPRGISSSYRRTTDIVDRLRRADVVVTPSDAVARHVRRNGVRDVTVVPNFVDPLPTLDDLPAARRVLFAGRLTKAKGLDVLLRATAVIDAELEVCGDGWWGPAAQRTARQLGIAERVAFRGWLEPEALSRAYRAARVIALPSLWPEPFGLTGIEALAHGRPVIASDGGGVPEWLDDRRTGVLVPPGDVDALAEALDWLLGDDATARRLGAAGAEQVARRFSADVFLQAITDVYRRAVRRELAV
jgi:glycosyltransferase involved in cell wall biosynthesis